jgi:hypothetical protein
MLPRDIERSSIYGYEYATRASTTAEANTYFRDAAVTENSSDAYF